MIETAIQKRIDSWLSGPYDPDTKKQIQTLLQSDPQKLIDAFYTTLSFGTGGLRGIVGIGSNRINFYTIEAATQGLANYLKQKDENPSVVIGYDSRIHSRAFAEAAARVLAGNGIVAYLFKELRPTPLISFACRHFHASGAIMITASHNPAEYNGYKVYDADGGQVLPPDDVGIIEEVNKISSPNQVKHAPIESNLIKSIGQEIDRQYLQACKTLEHFPEQNKKEGKNLSIVYTSLHGTGITLIPKILDDWGFSNVILVEGQCDPDGTFPTVSYPNPEEEKALSLGIETLEKHNADLLLATDPDADRVGVAVRHKNKTHLLNGNQLACILLAHVCRARAQTGRQSSQDAYVKTIATSELFQKICDDWKKPCYNTLTGFKYIAGLIKLWEAEEDSPEFVFGAEESYGYLLGSFARDKDAVVICSLIAEAALQAKLEGATLIDRLHELYQKHGIYLETLLSIQFEETKEGREKMAQKMESWKSSPPKEILGLQVKTLEDYTLGVKWDLLAKTQEPLGLPKTNALLLWLEDGTKLLIRPSGTEPKVKVYCGIRQEKYDSIEEGLKKCKEKAKAIVDRLLLP